MMLNLKLLYIISICSVLLTLPVYADTTFFEDQDDFFIMNEFPSNNDEVSSGDTSDGGGSSCNRRLEIISDSEITVSQGEEHYLEVVIKNTGECTLYDINVSLEVPFDLHSTSILIDKLDREKRWWSIFSKESNKTVIILMKPSPSALGNYKLTLKASTYEVHQSKEVLVVIKEETEREPENGEANQNNAEKGDLDERQDFEESKKKELHQGKIPYLLVGLLFAISLIMYYKKEHIQKLFKKTK